MYGVRLGSSEASRRHYAECNPALSACSRAAYLTLEALCAGGGIIGDLPPYEAFPIGGTNSVRGYSEGGIGSGRNYAAGTAELHFPLFKPLQVPM